ERQKQERIIEENFNDNREKFKMKLKELLILNQQDRYDKQQSFINYKVWTNKGWSKVNKIIRHKTNKKIFRIITQTSIIDVSEDHSLIDKDGNYLTPKMCKIGTELL